MAWVLPTACEEWRSRESLLQSGRPPGGDGPPGGMGRLEGWAACGGWAVLQAPLPRLLNEIGLFRNREGGDFASRVRK